MKRLTAVLVVLTILTAAAAVMLGRPSSGAASLPQLTRYPYLTDVVSAGGTDNATINWATDRSQTGATATYGEVGVESSTAHEVAATRTAITVNGVAEYQWKATLGGLRPNTSYSYRVFLEDPDVDLLGADGARTFTTPPAPGDPTPFSFAVFGDWGTTDTTGANPDQANLEAQIAASGASFAISTGDVANPNGNQTNYGDLFQTGASVSNVFGPSFYPQIGDGIPMFVAQGNHGLNSTMFDVWPQPTAPVLSEGSYRMDSYSLPGTNTASYPSVWYAFTVGNARFYILTAAWSNANVGSGTLYSNDQAAHWTTSSAEYQWLLHDLATHPARFKFAAFHFPMYTDNATESTDPYLHGPGSLAELLSSYGVQFVFNGHAHIYERNYRQPGESFVSYVTGAGGDKLEPLGATSAFDAYGLGWSYSKNKGYATGAAPVPASTATVFSFLLVTVSGTQVTVTPINSLGEPFDVVTYKFGKRR